MTSAPIHRATSAWYSSSWIDCSTTSALRSLGLQTGRGETSFAILLLGIFPTFPKLLDDLPPVRKPFQVVTTSDVSLAEDSAVDTEATDAISEAELQAAIKASALAAHKSASFFWMSLRDSLLMAAAVVVRN